MANILITAGATQTDIDRVRAITNVFRGHTGCRIAGVAARRGHNVTLLCSDTALAPKGVRVMEYRTFEELHALMEREITSDVYDAVIHSAAVSDYSSVRVSTAPDAEDALARDGKISSSHASLWIELKPTPKLLDKIRSEWGFRGKLAMFKLEIGMSANDLVAKTRRRLHQSGADVAAANCLEWYKERVLFVDASSVTEMPREHLDASLLERLGL